jgi:hypothetical protein
LIKYVTSPASPNSARLTYGSRVAELCPVGQMSPVPYCRCLAAASRADKGLETCLPWCAWRANHEVMHVEAINIGPSEALEPVGSVTAVTGKGLVGDRHFSDHPEPGNALTLIEAEVLEDVGLTGAQSRRQVVVRGVRLTDLIGKRFRVGDVECLGVEICEPCLHLQRMTRPGIIKDLIHRGGLNADILSGGTISVGDPVSARAG